MPETSESTAGPGALVHWQAWLARPGREIAVVTAFFALLTLALFASVLFGPGDTLIGLPGADLDQQFVHWRAFGFGAIAAGHFPLWNPHIYGGTQYFGGFQSALLYPPNALYLVLPLPRAINAGIALHVFLAGWFTYFWVRHRGLHPLAAVLAGVLFMFSGPYFLHIIAGHLPNLCAMVWGPLILLAIDGWMDDRRPRWLLLGSLALALQILAGHPQYVFYTGVACALYVALQLCWNPRRWKPALGLAAIPVGGAVLSAVQLLEGLHASAESLRSKGTSISFAGVFSFPPENLLGFILPNLFGDMVTQPYWGRHLLWEMCPFIGVAGFLLIALALFRVRGTQVWVCMGTAAILFVLAFGRYTPLFEPLYYHVPGFDKFRGWSKFIYPATLFLVMLGAIGCDCLLRLNRVPRALGATLTAAGAAGLGAGWWALWSAHSGAADAPGPWDEWIQLPMNTGEVLTTWDIILKPEFVQGAARCAGRALLTAGATLVALGVALQFARRRPLALLAVPAIALAELVVFAAPTLVTFELSPARRELVRQALVSAPIGDGRVFDLDDPNAGMTSGEDDLWGYDPGVTRRYAEFMAYTQGIPLDEVTQDLRFQDMSNLFATLLRCRVGFSHGETADEMQIYRYDPALVAPHVMIVPQARVVPPGKAVLDSLAPPFDPRTEVILESTPDPAPANATGNPAQGRASIVAATTDSLTIEADLPAPAILVITDAYSDGWRARSLLPAGAGSSQAQYRVMPADYCLQAIPLAAGRHRLLLEYRPAAFVLGLWISGIGFLAWIAVATWLWRRQAL